MCNVRVKVWLAVRVSLSVGKLTYFALLERDAHDIVAFASCLQWFQFVFRTISFKAKTCPTGGTYLLLTKL